MASQWTSLLRGHPDKRFTQYVLAGIADGFRVGFDYARAECRSAQSNPLSADSNPEVVSRYLQEEVALGRVVGPLSPEEVPGIHISPFGVIPKGHVPGKWRLIVDLSSPAGKSVNDGVCPELCSLTYNSVDDVARTVASLGKGALLAKMDVKSAYRIVPVHPQDRLLLGMKWKGMVYVDTRLPFGLRSAPKIFTAIADAVEWCFQDRGVQHVYHYLDDYITIGRPDTKECADNMAIMVETCGKLGVPLAPEKCEGPATCITYLGIEVDSGCMELRLPPEKLLRVKAVVIEWLGRKAGKRRDLESLVGLLQHAAKVVRPGRRFVRRIIQLMASVKSRDRFIRLNAEFRSDLQWWNRFLDGWNGIGILQDPAAEIVDIESDASGSWGCAAVWGPHWLQWQWSEKAQQWHIAPKELLPVLLACAVWGEEWSGKLIQCHCDNMAVVEVINCGYSKDRELMHLLRCLFFITEHWRMSIRAVHIPGKDNVRADALSRNDFPRLLQAAPDACVRPTRIPLQVLALLVEEQPDWVSPRWTELFVACIRRA